MALDDREEFTPGWKFSEYEMRGVPLRIEIGPARREGRAGRSRPQGYADKIPVPLADLNKQVKGTLGSIQDELLRQAREFLADNTRDAADYGSFKEIIETKRGFVRALWCGDQACEDRIKTETMATIRVIPFGREHAGDKGACVACGKDADTLAWFARAY